MPKLTRAKFVESLDSLWAGAQANFAKDHTLHGHMVALDPMGRQKYFLNVPEDEEIARRGIIAVPGPWREHLDLLAREFTAHKAVAAIIIGEAWLSSGEAATDVLSANMWPHEHPLSDEIVFVAGFWPREYVANGYQARIIRDDHGEHPHLTGHTRIDGDQAAYVGYWILDLLPKAR